MFSQRKHKQYDPLSIWDACIPKGLLERWILLNSLFIIRHYVHQEVRAESPVSHPQSFWYSCDVFLAFNLLGPSPVWRNVKYLTQKVVRVKETEIVNSSALRSSVYLEQPVASPYRSPFLSICSSLVTVHQKLPCILP